MMLIAGAVAGLTHRRRPEGAHAPVAGGFARRIDEALRAGWIRSVRRQAPVSFIRGRELSNFVSFSVSVIRRCFETKTPTERKPMKSAENQNEQPLASLPKIVSREEWQRARDHLLVKEKAATKARDALNAERR